MSMSPKNRAAMVRPQAGVIEYHVYDDKTTEIGGITVVEKDSGARVVRLTAGQAQWPMDQGVIGFKAKSELSQGTADAMKQFRKEKFEPVPSGDQVIEPAEEE